MALEKISTIIRRWAVEAAGEDTVDGLRNLPYEEYLLTKHWKDTRQRAIRAAGRRCQVCEGTYRLEVHHRTYERLGEEELADLSVLCNHCHKRLHQAEDGS